MLALCTNSSRNAFLLFQLIHTIIKS